MTCALRPEGDAGPLARSLASYENYYAQWGQTWERMMLIKARAVAGDARLGAEFLEMVAAVPLPAFAKPPAFCARWRPSKDRIENEVVKAGEIERNVKLGRGGIREIEFVAQTLQLLHAGRAALPARRANRCRACKSLSNTAPARPDDAARWSGPTCSCATSNTVLQMEANRQTHTIPTERRPGTAGAADGLCDAGGI